MWEFGLLYRAESLQQQQKNIEAHKLGQSSQVRKGDARWSLTLDILGDCTTAKKKQKKASQV